jgi:hypothetical protein
MSSTKRSFVYLVMQDELNAIKFENHQLTDI